ncbi:MAG: hypothetical protein FJ387_14145 [Verrucomicrobia bacterium]|nr:hypothetical protein [Verrucomicrobiota bacterium]
MSRAIRLSRIHALNWYGYKDTVPVEGNVLLAGVTGSGKSILMDLIQLVLVGDQRLIRFNQSATGDRSGRTLKGYCLGDTKEEENGATQYMRPSAITYAALEFAWPGDRKAETWGLRVEFASAAEAHGKVTPFLVPGTLERSDFLDQDKRPLDYAAFKAFAEGRGGRLYTEGIEAYLRDMAQPVHLNFERSVLRSLLPTAMSFTFLRSFNEFCRQFILPADRLDVTDVTASYRTFLSYERDLTQLNDQLVRLQAIRQSFAHWIELRRNRALARYLEAQLRHEHAHERLEEDEAQLAKLKAEYADEERRLKELEELIPALQRQMDGIKAAINETPEGRLYSELRSQHERLSRQIAQLSGIGATLEAALANRVRNARAWLKELRALPLDLEASSSTAVDRAIHGVESGGVTKAAETLGVLGEAAKRAAGEVNRSAALTLDRLAEIRQQLGQLRDEIGALRVGKLPFPTRLLDALNHHLPSPGADLPAQPLCQLCEVTDERWRPAIEVAFTRKFAIVVSPEHYDQAEAIYHALEASELGPEPGRESLINPAKALKLKKPVRTGSLAEKLKTEHPVAEATIRQLFGDLICVEQREELREHEHAILPDGFMVRGAWVERARFYDGNPFVGKRGLEQQLAWKEKQVADREAEERRLLPVERAVKSVGEGWRERFDVPADLYQDLARAQQLPKLNQDLADNTAKLNNIDRAKFDELAQQQATLDTDRKRFEEERRHLDRSEKRGELRRLDCQVAKAREEVARLAERFESIRNETDISPWLNVLEDFRSQVLARFPAKDAAATRFNEQFHDCSEQATGTWEQLKALRRELAVVHSKFADLPVESESNDPHEKQLAKLEQSDIPEYTEKSSRERKNWEVLFRTHVLEKLHQALSEVVNLVVLLNASLKQRPIGNHRYQLRYWKNPDFTLYHDLLAANALARSDELFFVSAEPRFRDAIERLLKTLTEQPDSAEAARLLDYRHYYEYDLEVVEEDGRKTSVDRHSDKFSGGENQSPYFIAILASYLRAYRRYGTRRHQEPSLGLVPIDEAFSKLSGERIKDCITALKAFDLQGVFSMSTGNIPYAFEHCDWLVVVSKEERRLGKRTEIRNIPVSLARNSEDAKRLMNR